MVSTTGRVEVQELDAVPTDRAGAAFDGGGNVVELQVGEYPETLVVQGIEGFGPGRGVELVPHLDDAEPRRHALRVRERVVEPLDVEHENEMITRVCRCRGCHHSSIAPMRSRTRATS